MGSVGGLTRTYGLNHHFSQPPSSGPRAAFTRKAIKRVGRYFRPYWRQWVVIALCIGVSAGLGVLPPFCVARIFDQAIPTRNLPLVGWLVGAMIGLALVSGLIGVLQQSLAATAGQGLMCDLRHQMFLHLQRMSLRFYTSSRTGEIVSRINNDVGAVQGVATNTLVTIAGNIATLVFTAGTLFHLSWRLAFLAIAIVPLFYIPSRIVGRIRWRLATQAQENQASMLVFLHERLHVGGMMLSSIYGRQADDAGLFRQTSSKVRDLNIRQAVTGRWLMMTLSVFSALGPAIVYWYGGKQAMLGNLTTGQLIAFAALLTLLYRPLVQLAGVYGDIQASLAVFERIFEYLDMPLDVADPPRPSVLARTQGHIVFDEVCFTYPSPAQRVEAPGAEPPRPALSGVSFEIQPGQRVALVGPSGAGKTTLTYLLPRFYDPTVGSIRLDGHDLRSLSQEQLRSHIAMVTQETFLFHATIRENLLYARPDASEAQVFDACRAASIHDFITGLPEGYDTIVGERGFRLSGGEKQRISIARALLKDPRILVLDEATSSLDATNEYLIQGALEELLRGRTSLVIAHRLSTILSADRIVVLKLGRVVEVGAHAELLEANGLYAELFRQQFARVLRPASA